MTLLEIARALERSDRFELAVLDPDRGAGLCAGERIEIDGVVYVHRPYRVWLDLAERLGFRMCTPRAAADPCVTLVFERVVAAIRKPENIDDVREKYGVESMFARTSKLEEPGFVLDFADALDRISLPAMPRILDLGVNTGDEIELLLALRPELRASMIVGVDRSASALIVARTRFPGAAFVEADLDRPLELDAFDLVISIATLQSGTIDDRELLRRITQRHLAASGSLIIGVPNCRLIGSELSYGARTRNVRQPELGLVVKDLAFYRKYLQQHGKRVFVTGKHYLLVTAVPA